jgi:flagellar biosynthesis anti-sigma factor FlgM
MKIDNNRADLDAVGARRSEAARPGQAQGTDRPSKAGDARSDKVELSSTAHLVTSATSAAQQASEVRPDVVARAKELLERGDIGRDPHRLADALIDRALAND